MKGWLPENGKSTVLRQPIRAVMAELLLFLYMQIFKQLFKQLFDFFVFVLSFSYSIVIKTKIIRAMPGLGIFKHYAVTVVGLTADDSHAVIIIGIHI